MVLCARLLSSFSISTVVSNFLAMDMNLGALNVNNRALPYFPAAANSDSNTQVVDKIFMRRALGE